MVQEYWISINDSPGYKVDEERFAQLRSRAGCTSDLEAWRGLLPSSLPVRGWVEVSK